MQTTATNVTMPNHGNKNSVDKNKKICYLLSITINGTRISSVKDV